MPNQNGPLEADELMVLAERVAQLNAADAEWVGILLDELLRARTHEAELLAARAGVGGRLKHAAGELDEQLVQIALDTAEWLRTLWNVGYMGAGKFRSLPRSAFPAIDLDDIRKSSLFARIRQGKYALPFPPPTRHGLPWHELLEGAEQVHPVEAEIVRDETGQPQGAIIEACAEWLIIEETTENQVYVVQHQGLGPVYRLRLVGGVAAELQRESPTLKRRIFLQRRGGFHSYALEWLGVDGRTHLVPLRAATWERAESAAEHWLATTHPQMYGQVCFERSEE